MTQSVISWIPAVAAGLIYLAVGTRVVRGMSGSQTPEALKALRWPALGAALLHLVAVGMEMFGPGVIHFGFGLAVSVAMLLAVAITLVESWVRKVSGLMGILLIVAAAGAVAAGVVGYGVYNYVSGRKLQALLPEGVAAPENRAQTALLLWNTAGRPEPAEAPAFADVADPDTAKAAQWCVEQGLMKRRLNGKFAPGSSIPAYQVLNAYRKLAGG